MKILYIFCLLCSVIVLAVEEGKEPPEVAPKTTAKKTTTTTTTTIATTTSKKAPDTTKNEETTAALNKLQCPACTNLTANFCEQEEPAPCRGSQIFCLESTGKIVREDNSNSTFVVKRCDTELILTTLLGAENVKPGRYIISMVFEMAHEVPTEKPAEASTEETTEASTEKTSKAPSNETPNKKPTKTTPKPSSSPSISPCLFFTLWLPSLSCLLLMNLLS